MVLPFFFTLNKREKHSSHTLFYELFIRIEHVPSNYDLRSTQKNAFGILYQFSGVGSEKSRSRTTDRLQV